MKRSDIRDEHVIALAQAWRDSPFDTPGVLDALAAEGVPPKLALAKVEHLISRGLLVCGVSPNYAWPRQAVRRAADADGEITWGRTYPDEPTSPAPGDTFRRLGDQRTVMGAASPLIYWHGEREA